MLTGLKTQPLDYLNEKGDSFAYDIPVQVKLQGWCRRTLALDSQADGDSE